MFQRCFSGSEALNPRSSKRTDRCQRPHRKGRPFEIRLEQQLLFGVTRKLSDNPIDQRTIFHFTVSMLALMERGLPAR